MLVHGAVRTVQIGGKALPQAYFTDPSPKVVLENSLRAGNDLPQKDSFVEFYSKANILRILPHKKMNLLCVYIIAAGSSSCPKLNLLNGPKNDFKLGSSIMIKRTCLKGILNKFNK